MTQCPPSEDRTAPSTQLESVIRQQDEINGVCVSERYKLYPIWGDHPGPNVGEQEALSG